MSSKHVVCGGVLSVLLGATLLLAVEPTGASLRHAEARSEQALPGLSGLVEAAVRRHRVPGLVARTAGPHGVSVAAAGQRQRQAPPAFEATDPVHIGSALKAMTATLVARLVERGIVRWDTTLAEAFHAQSATMHPSLATVTIVDLLAHRSGLTDEVPEELYTRALGFTGTGQEARELFIPEYLALAPGGTRGAFAYSNFGYAVAGALVERATGRSYDDLMREEIFEPLGMLSARHGAPGSNDPRVIDAPRGHDAEGRPLRPEEQDDPRILAPAGTYSMTLEDWERFARVHLGPATEGAPFISDDSRLRLQTPVGGGVPEISGRYALGWYVIEIGGDTVLAHDGSNSAWLSRIALNRRARTIVLLSCNEGSERAANALDRIAFHPRVQRWFGGR